VPPLIAAGRKLVRGPETIGLLTPTGYASAAATERAWAEYEAWREALEQKPEGTLAEALVRRPLSPLARVFVNAELEFDGGAPAARLAVRSLTEGQEMPGGDRMVVGGYDGLVESLARNLTIRRGAEIISVFCGDPEVVVTLRTQERVNAEAVVCTLPLGVLQTMTGSFFGPGRNPLTQIKGLAMGQVERIVGVWDRVWWPTDVSAWATSPTPPNEISLVMDVGQALQAKSLPALAGFWLGQAALNPPGAEAAQAQFLRLLSRLFDRAVPAPRWMQASSWGRDPFSRGAYAYLTPEAPPSPRALWQRPWGRLVWAGEHTSIEFPATVHGALLSGQRAADQVTDLLR
jgi:monoamine oxidase